MKYIFQLPIFVLMLWASGKSYASHCVALSGGDIEAYVTKACSASSLDGAIRVKINGTTGPFELRYFIKVDGIWKILGDPIIITQPTEDIKKNLSTGEYMVVVIDNRCAMAEMEVELDVNDPITISATPEPICQDGTGIISPVVSGGQTPYTFQWSNGATDQNLKDLFANTYTVTVMDALGCTSTGSYELNISEPIKIEGISHPICTSGTGRIEPIVSGGFPPYSFMWNSGATSQNIYPFSPGSYVITVSDFNQCTKVKEFILENFDINIQDHVQNDVCNTSSGSITLNSEEVYLYKWISPINHQNTGLTSIVQNLEYGVYGVEISIPSNPLCKTIKYFIVEEADLDFNIYGTPSYCQNSGTAEVILPSNIDPNKVKYKWDNGSTSKQITGLGVGWSEVTVTINNCNTIKKVKISNIPGQLSVVQPECNKSNGSLFYNLPEVPIPNFSIIWSTGHTTTALTNLSAGTYSATVSSGNCVETFTEILNGNPLEKVEVTCTGDDQITMTAIPLPNISPIYHWDTGQTTQTITTQYGETHYVTVTTSDGCQKDGRGSTQKPNLIIENSVTCDLFSYYGIAQIEGSYSEIEWSSGETNDGLIYPNPGLHSVTVTLGECEEVKNFEISSSDFDIYINDFRNPATECSQDGEISIESPQSGLPIKYYWSSGHKGKTISGLGSGTYEVTAILGPCSKTLTIDLCSCYDCSENIGDGYVVPYYSTCQNSFPQISSIISNASTPTSTDGSIRLNIVGNTGTLTFEWQAIYGESAEPIVLSRQRDILNIKSGLYTVKVNDGCFSEKFTFYVNHHGNCTNSDFNVSLQNSPCLNGSIILKAQNANGAIFYQCSNGFTGIANANHMMFIPTQGLGTFTIKAIEISTGCERILNVLINGQVTSSMSVDIPLNQLKACNSIGSGAAIGTITGGTEPILSRWTLNGEIVSNNPFLTFKKDGYYTFEAYDNCGHKATKSILLGCNSCSEFPVILQYNKCWDACDKPLESDCSKLKLTVNCGAKGKFTIVWPDGSLTGVRDCNIYQGPKYFKPKFSGESKVIIISETGCIKELYFYFNEGNWCLEDLKEGDNGKVVGVISDSGGCGSDPILFPNSNFKKLAYIPNDRDFPCLKGGKILIPWECQKPEVLEPTEFEYFGESTNGDCTTCDFVIENVHYSVETCEFKCPTPTDFKISPNPIFFAASWVEIKLTSLIKVTAKLSLTVNGTHQVGHEYYLDIVPGLNEIQVDLNGVLPITNDALFQIEFPNSCPKLFYRIIVLQFHDNETDKFKGNCDDDFINIILDNKLNDFVVFAPIVDSLGLKINSAIFQGEGDLTELPLYSEISIPFEKVKILRVDSSKNHFILGSDSAGILKYQKINPQGIIYWTNDLPYLDVKTMSDGTTGDYNIIAYDSTLQKYLSLPISKDGVKGTFIDLPLQDLPYKLIHQSGQTTVALEDNGRIIFATTSGSIIKNIPQGVIIKDIKTLENGNILAAGEFNGHISVGDVSYNSEEFDNAIFITYDKVGNILASQSVQNYRDETVQGIATKGNEEVAYHGKYKEIVYYAPDPADNVIDSCIFVNIISLVDTSCTLLPPVLTLDETACKLSLSSSESGVIYTLHEDLEGVWQEVNGAVFPYQPEANGRYRASAKKEGCTTAFSDITEVNCLKIPLPCDITLLDLTYDTLANKFAWYWGETKFGLDSIFGNTIDKTLITSTITTFVKYQISYLWVKHIRYDMLGNIYIFGTDGTTKSFVTTVTTSGVITTTWYQDVILLDIIWRPVLYQYSLLMYDKILNQYTHQIRRLTGQLISTENLGDFQSGKYTFEMLQYHKTGYYTNVEYSSAQTRIRWYMGPTTYVTNLPPAVSIKRIQRWSQDRWMVSTEYTGTIIINGTTYTSIGYNTVIFIWYDNQGNVIKVTEIKHSRDEFISHVSTDGIKKVAYTGIYRDTIYNSTYPNGYIIEECAFMDGFDVEFNTPAPIVVPTSSKTDRIPKASQEFRFYPNPFSKGINLDITSDIAEEVNIETYNMVGALMFTTKLDLQQGQNVRYMDAFERIPAGVYMVKIKSITREHMTKVIRIE